MGKKKAAAGKKQECPADKAAREEKERAAREASAAAAKHAEALVAMLALPPPAGPLRLPTVQGQGRAAPPSARPARQAAKDAAATVTVR